MPHNRKMYIKPLTLNSSDSCSSFSPHNNFWWCILWWKSILTFITIAFLAFFSNLILIYWVRLPSYPLSINNSRFITFCLFTRKAFCILICRFVCNNYMILKLLLAWSLSQHQHCEKSWNVVSHTHKFFFFRKHPEPKKHNENNLYAFSVECLCWNHI